MAGPTVNPGDTILASQYNALSTYVESGHSHDGVDGAALAADSVGTNQVQNASITNVKLASGIIADQLETTATYANVISRKKSLSFVGTKGAFEPGTYDVTILQTDGEIIFDSDDFARMDIPTLEPSSTITRLLLVGNLDIGNLNSGSNLIINLWNGTFPITNGNALYNNTINIGALSGSVVLDATGLSLSITEDFPIVFGLEADYQGSSSQYLGLHYLIVYYDTQSIT